MRRLKRTKWKFEEKSTITIGHLWGIPFKLDFTIVAFWLFIWVILDVAIKKEFSLLWVIPRAIVALVSTALHEMSHAYVAIKSGMKVESITLSPQKSFVRFPAEPADPDIMIKVAIAGPLAGLSVGIVFFFVDLLYYRTYDAGSWFVRSFICIVEIFQFMPIRPFDGGWVYREHLRKKFGPGAENYIEEQEYEVKRKLLTVQKALLLILKFLLILLVIDFVCLFIYLFMYE